MNKNKSAEWNNGYQAGMKSKIRRTPEYKQGRNQGRQDAIREIEEHVLGGRQSSWVAEMLAKQEREIGICNCGGVGNVQSVVNAAPDHRTINTI